MLEARRPTAQEAGDRLEREWVEGADLGNKISTGSNEGKGQLQQHLRASRRARDRPIELLPKGGPVAEFLRPPGGNHHVRQSERAGRVLEEGAFADVRLHQVEMDMWILHRQQDGQMTYDTTDINTSPCTGPHYPPHSH